MRSILVPSLLAIAMTAPAAELMPGLQVGGWGRGVAETNVREAANPRHDPVRDVGSTEVDPNAIGEAELWAEYRVERWTMRVDLFASSDPEWTEPDDSVLAEQAYVEGAFGAGVVRVGRWRNTWLGWEGHHAPELFRVGHSLAWDWNVQNHALLPNQPFLSEGIGLRTPDGETWQAELNIVEDVLGDGETASSSDIAIGGAFRGQDRDIGMIELGWAWDPDSTAAGPGKDVSALAVDLNGHLSAWRDQGWLFAAEIQAHRHPELTVGTTRWGNDLIVLGMVRRDLGEATALTLMVDWVERGFAAPDNEAVEYALAVTHRPHQQVRLDAEISYDDESADDADAYGAAVSAMITLP